PGDRVRALERRDDALEPGELAQRQQRLGVGYRHVPGAPGVAEHRVLGADARVVEPGGDRVGLEDLAGLVGARGRERAWEAPGPAGCKRGPVAPAQSFARRLDADQLDGF